MTNPFQRNLRHSATNRYTYTSEIRKHISIKSKIKQSVRVLQNEESFEAGNNVGFVVYSVCSE